MPEKGGKLFCQVAEQVLGANDLRFPVAVPWPRLAAGAIGSWAFGFQAVPVSRQLCFRDQRATLHQSILEESSKALIVNLVLRLSRKA